MPNQSTKICRFTFPLAHMSSLPVGELRDEIVTIHNVSRLLDLFIGCSGTAI